jgi:hypothetical protein
MRRWIGISLLAVGLMAVPHNSSAQEPAQVPKPAPQPSQPTMPTEPPSAPVPEEPSRTDRIFKALAPDTLDMGMTKCASCRNGINGGGIKGVAWKLPVFKSLDDKGLSLAAGLTMHFEGSGIGGEDEKDTEFGWGVTLGPQYQLVHMVAIKGGLLLGPRTRGFLSLSLNYNERPATKQ